jgi:S1-C subfamily serine protease
MLGLRDPRGVLVASVVEASPALKSGIHGRTMTTNIGCRLVPIGGDVIKADNIPVGKVEDILPHIERDKEVGDKMTLTILRNASYKRLL